MPANLFSEPKTTISYAIDLLKAHQIRRENVFLHKELQICRKEVAALCDEIRDLRASIQVSNSASEKAFTLAENNNARLDEQGQEVEVIQQACKTIHIEMSNITNACTETHHKYDAQYTLLEKKVSAMNLDFKNADSVRQQQVQKFNASVEHLQHTLECKADASIVESLVKRVEELRNPVVDHALGSVSRVPDTFERRQSSCAPANVPIPPGPLQGAQTEEIQISRRWPENTTVPDDIDLDANANTISYGGHRYLSSREENETLEMLPLPQAEATQLAKINTLGQRRFEDWEHYYSQGLKLIETLPHTFEETIVRNFVGGLFSKTHKQQCQQWLDSKGWNWDNITSFGSLCSQLPTRHTTTITVGNTCFSTYAKKMERVLAGADTSNQNGKSIAIRKTEEPARRKELVSKPPRRSQRLLERESQKSHELIQTPDTTVQGRKGLEGLRDFHPRRVQPQAQQRPQNKNRTSKRIDRPLPATVDVNVDEVANAIQPAGNTAERYRRSANGERKAKPGEVQAPEQKPTEQSATRVNADLRKASMAFQDSVPQLVPNKRRLAAPIEDSSDDAGFLYRTKPSAQVALVNAPKQGRHKRRRLPLPPPPEIPILPTSSEE